MFGLSAFYRAPFPSVCETTPSFALILEATLEHASSHGTGSSSQLAKSFAAITLWVCLATLATASLPFLQAAAALFQKTLRGAFPLPASV